MKGNNKQFIPSTTLSAAVVAVHFLHIDGQIFMG